MKDNFSSQAKLYAQFRPSYPQVFFDFLLPLVKNKNCVWDCATGNGQVASILADSFEKVYATDISQKQLDNAVQKANIIYKLEPAEQTSFANDIFDLITVGQAAHWFDFEKFYAEVIQVLRPGGVIAIFGYAFMRFNDNMDKVIGDFYSGNLDGYWDDERKYVDEDYKTIPFPFDEIKVPAFTSVYEWNVEQLIGYLNTWSAVQHYIKRNGNNPVDDVEKKIKSAWGSSVKKKVVFPIIAKVGRRNS